MHCKEIVSKRKGYARGLLLRVSQRVLPLWLMTMLLCLTACEHEPVRKVYYIELSKVQAELCEGVKGNYEGRLWAFMCDTARHEREDEEGVWVRQSMRDSILAFPYMVGGYARPFVTIPDFPISWLSKVVPHAELAEALRTQPNISLTLAYQIQHDLGQDIRSKKGRLILFPSPVALYMTFGGSRHLVTFEFSNGNTEDEIFADDESTWGIDHIRLSLQGVRIDGKYVFDNRAMFEVWIDGAKVVRL